MIISDSLITNMSLPEPTAWIKDSRISPQPIQSYDWLKNKANDAWNDELRDKAILKFLSSQDRLYGNVVLDIGSSLSKIKEIFHKEKLKQFISVFICYYLFLGANNTQELFIFNKKKTYKFKLKNKIKRKEPPKRTAFCFLLSQILDRTKIIKSIIIRKIHNSFRPNETDDYFSSIRACDDNLFINKPYREKPLYSFYRA